MMTKPIDWHKALARITGVLVRGEQRVTTYELLTVSRARKSRHADTGADLHDAVV
jgi:hypothetical protein